MAEFKTEQERKEAAEQSLKGYEVCIYSKYVFILKDLFKLVRRFFGVMGYDFD